MPAYPCPRPVVPQQQRLCQMFETTTFQTIMSKPITYKAIASMRVLPK